LAQLGPGEFKGSLLLGPTLRESTYVIRKVSADEMALRKERARELTAQGEKHLADGNDYQALGAFVRALSAEPSYMQAHVNLARIYQRWRDYPQLIKRLQKIIELDPDNLRNYEWIAETYAQDYQRKKAIERYRKLMDLSDDAAQIEQARNALSHLESTAVKSYFENIAAARRHIRSKQYDRAAAVLNEAVESDPAGTKAYNLLARVHEAQNDYVKAIEIRKKILDLDPEDIRNLYILGKDYQRVTDQEKALQVFKKVIGSSHIEYFRLHAQKEIEDLAGGKGRHEGMR
jgi:tetratricopeptide (TPR) repeat protein